MCVYAYNPVSVGEGWFHTEGRGLQSEPSAALPEWPSSHGYTTHTQTEEYNFHITSPASLTVPQLQLFPPLTHLTLSSQSSLLQPGPNALNPPGVLRVAVGVSAHALVLLH